jgi:hypothetical protein
MPRLGRRHWMTTAVATLAMLAAPAAARAATYTVAAGNGPCGGADLACGSLGEAAAAAAPGDVFSVAPGTYDAATFAVGGVTISGAAGVAINGTMTFSGATGGPSRLEKVAISQSTGGAPAINVSGESGLELLDAAVVSLHGDGIIVTGGEAGRIIRSVVVTGGAETSAVRVTSTAGTPAKGLTLESVLLIGGGAGLRAETINNAIEAAAGDISIVARHVTAAGSTNGLVLDSTKALRLLGTGVGNIAATVTDSIVLDNRVANYAGVAGLGANTATLTASRSLQTGDRNVLFADAAARNFRLRPGSPAIDQGGIEPGESTTDIDGDPRPGPVTDLGADEFVNAPPVASIVVRTARPRAGQPVLLDGSGSTDREASYGGGIVQYRWSFGDGTTETTTTPTVLHTYGGEGAAAAQLVVVDRQGAVSAPAVARIDVGDGTPPVATITRPFEGQRIKLTTRRTRTVRRNGVRRRVTSRRKTRIGFNGVARDKSGVAFVLLTVEKLGRSSSSSSRARCTWYDARRGLVRRRCSQPVLLVARLAADGSWRLRISTRRQPSAGLYRVSVYAADRSGAFGNSAPARDRVVRFRLTR